MPTVLHRLDRWAKEDPNRAAQKYKEYGQWKSISAREFKERVYHLALFFDSQGMTSKDVGCILSPNCHQWVTTELAFALLGGKSAGMYPNSIAKDIQYILNHSESRFLAVKDQEFFDKALGDKKEHPLPDRVKRVLVFVKGVSVHPRSIGYEEALAEGRKIAEGSGAKSFESLLEGVKPETGSFIIYTSGTTGSPKGAVLTQDNLAYTANVAVKTWDLPFSKGELFSFLPLCHIAEKIQNVGVGITQRYTVFFATKFDAVSQELPEVNPSLLLSVPRLWEKMMEGVLAKVRSAPPPRKQLMQWALGVGSRVAMAKYSGSKPSVADLALLPVADKLVLSKVRAALGLPRPHTIASGAAALPAHVSRWFRGIGLEILEDFGQTESTGVICMTQRGVESAGTVGKPVQGVEFKIADDGELLTRGRHVFEGYYKDEATTREAIDSEGWLHTGDLGEYTPEGLVKIRGRKKEIMKSSGGKMVAPLPIEEKLKTADIISQVCLVGDGRKYFSAIVTLTESKLAELQKEGRLGAGPALEDPTTIAEVNTHVDELNKGLANYEKVKRFVVLTREFSIADSEMTPTLKMKRAVIESRYKDLIDQMYK